MKKATIILLFLSFSIQAQTWFKHYRYNNSLYGSSAFKGVIELPNGNILLSGENYNFDNNTGSVFLTQLSDKGESIWFKEMTYGTTPFENRYLQRIQKVNDTDYILRGNVYNTTTKSEDLYSVKFNLKGDFLQSGTIKYADSVNTRNGNTHKISASELITIGGSFYYSQFNRNNKFEVYSTDLDGKISWRKSYAIASDNVLSTHGDMINDVQSVRLTNGNFLAVANIQVDSLHKSGNQTVATYQRHYSVLAEFAANGDSISFKKIPLNSHYRPGIVLKNDSIFISSMFIDPSSKKQKHGILILNNVGDSLTTILHDWAFENDYDPNFVFQESFSKLIATKDNGFIATYNRCSYYTDRSQIVKYDSKLNVEWEINFSDSLFIGAIGIYDIIETSNGDFIAVGKHDGSWFVLNPNAEQAFAIRIKGNGELIKNSIIGNVFYDKDGSCKKDNGEKFFKNTSFINKWRVKLSDKNSPTNITYSQIDSTGDFNFITSAGDYEATLVAPDRQWQSPCLGKMTIDVNSQKEGKKDTLNFAIETSTSCPVASVDIGTSRIRSCFRNTYVVNYCHEAGPTISNSTVTVKLNEYVIPISSSIPWTKTDANTYQFSVGNLEPGDCGSFTILDSISCDAVMGSALCAKATISPDTICDPVDAAWDKSSVTVSGTCTGNTSACFNVTNTGELGNGDMQGDSEYRIYENNELAHTASFRIVGGATQEICWETGGKTIRLEADQRPGHPGHSRPRETVELCGSSSDVGHLLQAPNDDLDDFVSVFCSEVRASLDPNEKLVSPAGQGVNNISSMDNFVYEYHINFQNTGNDTAYWVIVRDTLSSKFIVESIEAGASSNPYTMNITSGNIVEFRFDNIYLVDSTTNEPNSHGWVKFKIKRDSLLQEGTVIKNRVGIVFDYNAPVLTEYATISLNNPPIITNTRDVWEQLESTEISVYPNPFYDQTTVKILNPNSDHYLMVVYDMYGKEVLSNNVASEQEKTVNRGSLSPGTYLLKILSREGKEQYSTKTDC